MKKSLVAFCAACAIAAAHPASAAHNPQATVTVTSITLAFNPTDLVTPALTASPVTASASINFTTSRGGSGGVVTVTPSSIASVPAGNTLDPRDFTLTCRYTGGNSGFVAAAPATLNGATTCGTLTQGVNNATSTFSIQLTLNDTAAATVPFTAATFFGVITVSATSS